MYQINNYKEEILKMAESNNEQPSEFKKGLMRGTGAASGSLGASLIANASRSGELSGRKSLYHNTDKANVSSIMDKGLLGSKALDPDNITNKSVVGLMPDAEKANRVYFGNEPRVARAVGEREISRRKSPYFPLPVEMKDRLDNLVKRKTVKVKMPLDKIKETNNPELLGAKNVDEYVARAKSIPALSHSSDKELKRTYNAIGKGTVTHEGNVSPKYIKGSKHYQKLTPKEVIEHIKNNKKMFAKGAGKVGLGLGAIGLGAGLFSKGMQKNKE